MVQSRPNSGKKYLSLCAGIEAATVAWHPLGWEAVAYSEIEKFPSALLKHHYPQTPNWGDMTKFKEWPNDTKIDLLVGGTPCQSFSLSGLRKGLDDPRGNLMLTYLAIAEKYRPRWLVWENVPGVLSSNEGKDFACLLKGMAELGYGFAYKVLDAQYFGVAQRRRRVFVVACLGSWRHAAAVLFERESLQRNAKPSREAGQKIAGTITTRVGTLDQLSSGIYSLEPVKVENNDAHAFKIRGGCEGGGKGYLGKDDCSFTLSTTNDQHILTRMAVRKLTPREYERLQGFPDDYTRIPFGCRVNPNRLADDWVKYQSRGKTKKLTREECTVFAADSPRYKALGNSMAVPVMRWLGERIDMIDAIKT